MRSFPLRSPDPGASGAGTPAIRPLGEPAQPPPPKIQAFEQKLGVKRHEDSWKRTPNTPGTGAIHVKTFHCRLSDDALGFIDQQINEWLDAHPQYEVKFVSSNVGEFQGKMGKEMHMIVQLWV